METDIDTGADIDSDAAAALDSTGTDLRAFALHLGGALSGVHRATRRRVRRELGLPLLSGAQVELLRLVAQEPGIGVTAAARELNLAGNSVSTLVNQLVAKDYLRREPSPADRRAAVLNATEAGRDRLTRWADERTRLFAEQLAHLAPEELEALRAAVPALRSLAAGLAERRADQPERMDHAMTETEPPQ